MYSNISDEVFLKVLSTNFALIHRIPARKTDLKNRTIKYIGMKRKTFYYV